MSPPAPSLRAFAGGLLLCLASCAPGPRPAKAPNTKGAPVKADVGADAKAVAVRGAPQKTGGLAWASFDAATFAKAKAERRFVLLDGAAEWCHWCHVMEAETYHDPVVRQLLADRFVAAKVDIDARPDIADRYADYGWPATVIFSPDGEEIGKYRGYLSPTDFIEILRAVVGGEAEKEAAQERARERLPDIVAPAATRATSDLTARWTALWLDDLFDENQGGWGARQKLPCGWNDEWALVHGARPGEERLQKRALFTLAQERRLIDPSWGGLYQYSIGESGPSDWDSPHFEKLLVPNALALRAYALAFELTKDARWKEPIRAIRRWVEAFMISPEGAFYTTQDADLNAHDPDKPFVDGHRYYALDDAGRRALGAPRIDRHVYARENGLAIAAYATVGRVLGDRTALAIANRAAAQVLVTHVPKQPPGFEGISHGPRGGPPETTRHLADQVALGWGLVLLDEAVRGTPDEDPASFGNAQHIASYVLSELQDREHGGFYAHTNDPGAVGVFARRRKPFDHNVLAVRFLAKIERRAPHRLQRDGIARALGLLSIADTIRDQGRFVGDLLSALDETRDLLPP